MSRDGIALYTKTDAERWIGEYEKNEGDLVSYASRCREGRKPFVERRGSIIDRAEAAGMDRQSFTDELKLRALDRKKAAIEAGQSEEVAEAAEILRQMLGGLANLPLGEAAIKANDAKPKAAKGAPDFSAMTLEEAKAILEEPKGKGRPSAAVLARRKAAAALISEAPKDGASGDQASAMAEAMGPDEGDNNVTDLRPRFMQKPYDVASPPNLPAAAPPAA